MTCGIACHEDELHEREHRKPTLRQPLAKSEQFKMPSMLLLAKQRALQRSGSEQEKRKMEIDPLATVSVAGVLDIKV